MPQITKKQHYIPRFYLRNFSNNNKMIYQYDVSTDNSSFVSINSICYQNYLYEFKDENDELIYCNWIENILSKWEKEFSIIINSIKNKAKNKRNCKTRCFLTSKEKDFLAFFISLQSQRGSYYIKEIENKLEEKWGDVLEKNSCRNAALIASLPIYKPFNEVKDHKIISTFKTLRNMSFIIGFTDNGVFFTSDNPITMIYENNPNDIEEVIFPLASNLVLYMLKMEKSKANFKNRLYPMDENNINYINNVTISRCTRWIFSKNTFNDKDYNRIKKFKKYQLSKHQMN